MTLILDSLSFLYEERPSYSSIVLHGFDTVQIESTDIPSDDL